MLAATGKKFYDRIRSRSRGRQRSRESSYDSYEGRSPSRPKPERKRSSSVSAAVAKGLGAIGLGSAADKIDPERRNSQKYDDRGHNDRGYDDRSRGYDDYSNGGYRDSRDVGALTPAAGAAGPVVGPPQRAASTSRLPGQPYRADNGPHHNGDPETDSDSDLGSSSGEEREVKKSRKKSVVTGALATVATIHAGHSIYQSMEKRESRRKALKEGDISPAEARREKNRARLQDAASVGIAALGIKGAYSEWNSVRGERKEAKEKKEALERHKQKREARRRKESILAAQAYRDGGYTGSMPNLAPSDTPFYGSDAGPYNAHAQGPPHYADDNPYASYAAPQPNPNQYSTPPPQHQYNPQYNPQYSNGAYQHPYDIPPPPMGPPRADTR